MPFVHKYRLEAKPGTKCLGWTLDIWGGVLRVIYAPKVALGGVSQG